MHKRTRYIIVMGMHAKDEALELLQRGLKWFEVQADIIATVVVSDQEGQLVSHAAQAWMADMGIESELQTAGHHDRLATLDTAMRVLLEGVRCMLLFTDAPKEAWLLAARHKATLMNMLPDTRGKGDVASPYERLWGIKPSVFGLRAFGSEVTVAIPRSIAYKEDKLARVGRTGILCGYTNSTFVQAWVWFPDTSKHAPSIYRTSQFKTLREPVDKTTFYKTVQDLPADARNDLERLKGNTIIHSVGGENTDETIVEIGTPISTESEDRAG